MQIKQQVRDLSVERHRFGRRTAYALIIRWQAIAGFSASLPALSLHSWNATFQDDGRCYAVFMLDFQAAR